MKAYHSYDYHNNCLVCSYYCYCVTKWVHKQDLLGLIVCFVLDSLQTHLAIPCILIQSNHNVHWRQSCMHFWNNIQQCHMIIRFSTHKEGKKHSWIVYSDQWWVGTWSNKNHRYTYTPDVFKRGSYCLFLRSRAHQEAKKAEVVGKINVTRSFWS